MIMECCKNGTDVDVNKLEASDARWYQLYVDQKQVRFLRFTAYRFDTLEKLLDVELTNFPLRN